MKVKLYMQKSRLRADGTSIVYFYLADGMQRKSISTEKSIEPKFFDNTTGRVLKGHPNYAKLNSYFQRELLRIEDIISELRKMDTPVTLAMVQDHYTRNNDGNFITWAEEELNLRQRGLIAFKTLTGYKRSIRNLKAYRAFISFNAINHTFLQQYRHYLVTVKKRRANGYYQDFAAIKKLHKIAVRDGLAKGNPFKDFALKREETNRNWNTQDELIALFDLLETGKISEAVKNTLRHYLFSCFSGLRFGDKKLFNESHIVNDRLKLKTSKRGKYVMIPFNDQARALLPHVLNRPLKQKNSRVNDDLEEAMQAAGINKHITYHCSRHTFAINCLLLGIDLLTVRDWLAHKSVVTTEIYAKIAAQYRDESMKKFDGFLNKKGSAIAGNSLTP